MAVARGLFADKGLEGTSVEEIAAHAEVSKPVVYEHFGGKEGLYDVVVDREVRRLHDAIYAAMNGEGVVLGWRRLISGLLAEGRLVRLGDRVAVPSERYHVLRASGRSPSAATRTFTGWLADQFEAEA